MRTASILLCLSFVFLVEAGVLLGGRTQRCGFNDQTNCPVFNYTNTNWGGLCQPNSLCSRGRFQSPIDLSGVSKGPGAPQTLNVLYAPSLVNLFNTGNKLLLPVPSYSGIFTWNNVVYTLNSLEFHTPSEHTIDGQSFDMEIQFKHTSNTGATANIAVLFQVGSNNPILDTFWSQIPQRTTCGCGNGRLEPWMGEECDEGPRNSNSNPNSCRTNCRWFRCGDGIIDATEICDNGALNSNTVPDACRTTCTLPYCGDGVLDKNNREECDDGNNVNGDGCSSRCTREETCGNGVIDVNEECDDGIMNSNSLPNACRLNCLKAYCGDGVVDTTEQCDGGAMALTANVTNLCRTTCTFPTCGDGILDDLMGEECDEVSPRCSDCRLLCGNGILDAGEQCDNGPDNCNTRPNRCRTNCTNPICGDGVTDRGEECDDGAGANGLAGARCSGACKLLWGNGVVDLGESCDNGALNSDTTPNACRTNARLPSCGDGVVDTQYGEECDTITATTFCRANCLTPKPADGVVDTYYGEECDDGNRRNGDGCSSTMLKECGNGVPDGNEECDNGDLNSDSIKDACRSSCTKARCGDGVEDSGEECDLGAANANIPNNCRLNCALPYCGDGIVDTANGEICDFGLYNSDTVVDGCSTTCVPNQCRQVVTDASVDYAKLLPAPCEKGVFTYVGSQTTPPCSEGVSWFVYEQVQTLSTEQLRTLQAAVGKNARPTQTLGTRAIGYPTNNPQRCGNGIREGDEECDDPAGNSNDQPNRCRTNCKLPSCGDGVADCGEQCDGGQVCNQDCTFGTAQKGNRTVVNMFFKDLIPYNYFCCNAQPKGRSCSPCASCFKQ
eukprot:TRINITY_DN2582_c0_g1_i1.p1 TRINITY_DN2582_c0_g1~~TRINITY_DN2582_c0_g1_i1.p1  ORF type:complete len:839 (-),score=304.57 TRINITY_DN2582_c0_g1_i1:204-2720(-)